MCVCVLETLILKIFKLRDYFERFLCCLDHWLSCMLDCIHICVFHISKNYFEKLARHLLDTSSIPFYLSSFSSIFFLSQSRHLLDTWWINRESSCILDSSSTPAGSIELLFLTLTLCCSIASSMPWLSKTRSSIPTSTDPSIPLDTCICWDLLAAYIRPLCDPEFISLRSLSLYFSVSLPKHSHLTPNLFLKDSSSFSKFLLTW